MTGRRKTGWETIKPEQRAGLTAAAVVLFLFPFWLPAGFVTNMVVSAAVSGAAFWIAWAISRRRRGNADSADQS